MEFKSKPDITIAEKALKFPIACAIHTLVLFLSSRQVFKRWRASRRGKTRRKRHVSSKRWQRDGFPHESGASAIVDGTRPVMKL